MRSASAAVVIDPSTSDRSYGPSTDAFDISVKWAMRTVLANTNSSSSQSSRLNWHPSHEANFQTAKVGRSSADADGLFGWVVVIARRCRSSSSGDATVGNDRTVAAEEQRSELAMPAQTDAALHVALE